MSINNFSNWILRPKPREEAKIRLFCFPYAGSSGIITFRFLVDMLPDVIEVCPIELPGRGARLNEQLINNLDEIINLFVEELVVFFDKPFIFLGHSMGALICYEVCNRLEKLNKPMPEKLYLSAYQAPHLNRSGKLMSKLSNSEFEDELVLMNGIDKNILENRELMDIVLPIIKNDYEVCETYNFSNNKKLNIPITAFGGKNDKDVKENHLIAWKDLTDSDFDLEMFTGDHFFIIKNKSAFLNSFKSRLLDDIKKYDNRQS